MIPGPDESTQHPAIDAAARMAIEHECEQLVRSFYSALDAKRVDELAGLFTADGRWNRLGKIVVGPDDIRAALVERPKTWVTVHLVTNLLVRVVSPVAATSEQYLLIYRFDPHGGQAPPFPVVPPIGLSMHRDVLTRTDIGWRIQEKDSRPIMADLSKVTFHRA